jgi:hypothetical protein
MITEVTRFRKAAALCRRKAARSSNPARWRGYAGKWDKLAEWAELRAQYPEIVSFVANALHAMSKASKQSGAEPLPRGSAVSSSLHSPSTSQALVR